MIEKNNQDLNYMEKKSLIWWFIASKSDHPLFLKLKTLTAASNIEIIKKKKSEILESIKIKSEIQKGIGIILVPGTEIDQEICQWAMNNHVKMINSPELTSLFRTRWKSMTVIHNQYTKMNQNIQQSDFQGIFFPETWFITKNRIEDRFGLDYTENDILTLTKNYQYFMFKRDRTHTAPHLTSKLSRSSLNKDEPFYSFVKKVTEQEAVIQEYIPSFDGKVIKIYGIGPNLWALIQPQDKDVIINPKPEDFDHIPTNSNKLKLKRDSVPIDQVLIEFGHFLYESIGLQLFGFDAIQTRDNRYFIVDINDFPGYQGIPEAAKKILSIIENS